MEILYEPELPWFKCISFSYHREEIADFIKRHLVQILDHETQPVDPDLHNEADEDDKDIRPDIQLVNKIPQVIPWCMYTDTDDVPPSHYDACRYPVPIVYMANKAVWRGFEDVDTWSVEDLFKRIGRLGRALEVPSTCQQFGRFFDSEATHNLNNTTVYLGNDKSAEAVTRASGALDMLFDCLVSSSSTPRYETMADILQQQQPVNSAHLILTEGKGPFKICFRWMSHVGLNHSTFAQPGPLLDENKSLKSGTTLRAQKRVQGTFLGDPTTYPLPGAKLPHHDILFTPFEGYSFTKKQPSAYVRPAETAAVPRSTRSSARKPVSKPNPTPKQTSSFPASPGLHRRSLKQPLRAVDANSTPKDLVAEWIETTGSANPEFGDDLISFEVTNPVRANASGCAKNATLGQIPSLTSLSEPLENGLNDFSAGDDLIWLPKEVQSNVNLQQPDNNIGEPLMKQDDLTPVCREVVDEEANQIQGHLQTLAGDGEDGEHLLDSAVPQPNSPTLLGQESPGWGRSLSGIYPVMGSDHQQSPLDDPEEALAIFGKHEKQDPEHFHTMHQRTGRNQGGRGGRNNRSSPAPGRGGGRIGAWGNKSGRSEGSPQKNNVSEKADGRKVCSAIRKFGCVVKNANRITITG